MATRTKKARRQRHTTPDSAQRLLALAKEWSSPIPWKIVAEREAKWQSARDYTNSLRRIAWKARDAGELENKELYQQIVDAEHQEEVWEKHLRAMSAQIAELESLIERLRPDLGGDYGPASQCPDIYTPRERAERVCNVLAKLTAAQDRTPTMSDKPKWEGGILSLGSITVKTFSRHPATNQRALLDAFEAAGWPTVIDNPLRDANNRTSSRTLNETLRDLRASISSGPLRFEADGNGGCRWVQNSP